MMMMMMMMITVIMIVLFGSQFISSTTYTGKFSQDKEIHEDQRLQLVELPSISNQLTLPHVPLEVSSSEMYANTIEALSSTIPDYEMQALKDLYDSTDGDNWKWTVGDVHWNFTNGNVNPCGWTGLDCSYDRSSQIYHVTSIYLINFNLHGTLPASLGQLAKLTALRLYYGNYGNSLTGTLPVSMGNLSELTWLLLDGHQLTGSIPAFLGQLLKLSIMGFSSNLLTGTLPSSLGQLSELTVLWLTGNLLTGTLPAILGQLSKLTNLGLDNNQLSGSIPDSLRLLSKLNYLSLSSNSFTGKLPDSLAQLPELYGLSLNDNSLTGTLPTSFGQLSELTHLDMSYNSLTGTLPASLGNLSKLSDLHLDNNQLIGTIPSSLCKCQEMYISLNHNKFICYPTCMTSSRYTVRIDENIPVCDGPSYEDICITESKSSKSMMIVWIVLPILFILLVARVALSLYLYYRYRYRYVKISHSSQSGENNQNNNIMDEDNDHIHDVNCDLSINEDPEAIIRYEDISTLVCGNREIMEVPSDAVDNMHRHVHNSQDPTSYDSNQSLRHIDSHDVNNDERNSGHAGRNDQRNNQILGRCDEYSENNYLAIRHAIRSYDEARRRIEGTCQKDSGTNKGRDHNDRQRNEGITRDRRRALKSNGASNEGRHQRRDHVSQVLEPVVIGELVSTVVGAVATHNEILNLPTASVANIDEEDVLYVDLFVAV